MFRLPTACLLTITPSLLAAACAADVVSSPIERWQQEVAAQAKAAQAELAIQTQILRNTEERLNRGQASDADLEYARESQLQALEWSRLLDSEAATLRATDTNTSNSPAAALTNHLRVPGLPLLFASDAFAWIELPATPQATRIIFEIQSLNEELHHTDLSVIYAERLQRQLDRLQAVHPKSSEALEEIDSLALHLAAAKLNLGRLTDVLNCPIVQSRSSADDRGDSAVPAGAFLAVTQRWNRITRHILLDQTNRTLAHLQSLSAKEQRDEQEMQQLQSRIELQHDIAGSFAQDLAFLKSEDTRSSRTVSTQSASRAGHLMRIMKRRWEQTQEELQLASSPSSDPTAESPPDVNLPEILQRDLEVAEAHLKYAMELYRLESGRSNDPGPLSEARIKLFELAADFQAEKAALSAQLPATRQDAANTKSTVHSRPAGFYDVDFTGDQVRMLELQQQRLELHEARAELCLRLARMANSRQAVAQNEN